MSRRSSTLGIPSAHSLSRTPSASSSSGGAAAAAAGSSSPAHLSHSRRTTLDSLVPLQPPSADALLAEKERECEELVDQVALLKRQLASRPPKSEIESLQAEFRMQESLLAGFQRENEKAMRDLERARQRERLLEGELEKLLGPNWALSLNLTTSSSPHSSPSLSHASPRSIFPSTATALSGAAGPAASSAAMLRARSTPLASSFVPSMETSFRAPSDDDDGQKEEADVSLASSGFEVEGAILSPVKKSHPSRPHPSTPSATLPPAHAPAADPDGAQTRREVEAVRMLLRGMEGRLTSREDELRLLVQQAEHEAALWRTRALPA